MAPDSSWISARTRSDYRTGLDQAIWVTSVRMRREDRSAISFYPSRRPWRVRAVSYVIDSSSFCAVPLFEPGGRSFVPACAYRCAARKGQSGLAVAQALPLASMLPGHAKTDPSTARGSHWTGRHRIGLVAREGAPLVENRPRDAGELVGQRNGEHIVV